MRIHENPPNKYAQDTGVELGLNHKQVTTPNFGFHTIEAIKAETKKGVTLEAAFEKYQSFNNIQVVGMTDLGLDRKQITTPNFGFHTINAISDLKKRTEELTFGQAFEMVSGKSPQDTQEFVELYLQSTRKQQKPISEMSLIRVVVNTGRGFGHQRAAITLMQKVREMGFKGTFDIQCDDRIGANLRSTETGEMYRNEEPLVSRQLISMIPGFELSESDSKGVKMVAGLGEVRISSLPNNYEKINLILPKADLAVCAADDKVNNYPIETKAKIFNASSYVGLEPTDWYQGSCFVVDQDGVVTRLPPASEMRLSSAAAYQQPDITHIQTSVVEERILGITSDARINSQLVYGLYPDITIDLMSQKKKESGHLNEKQEMQRIVEANIALSEKTGKPAIIILPQEIELGDDFMGMAKGGNSNIHFVNLTTDLDISGYKAGDVVIAHTGHLQQAVFDHLMLQGTTLPPVIEGCNSRELCESAGRPFIHGSKKYEHLKQYDVRLGDKQKLHTDASLCLEQGNPTYVTQLVQYMKESLDSNPELVRYHEQRRGEFFKRPDACELALEALGIQYKKTLSIDHTQKTSSVNRQTAHDNIEKQNVNAMDPTTVKQFYQASIKDLDSPYKIDLVVKYGLDPDIVKGCKTLDLKASKLALNFIDKEYNKGSDPADKLANAYKALETMEKAASAVSKSEDSQGKNSSEKDKVADQNPENLKKSSFLSCLTNRGR